MKICFYQRLAISLVAVFMLVMIACFYSTNELQKLTQQEAEQKLHIGLAEHLVEHSKRSDVERERETRTLTTKW